MSDFPRLFEPLSLGQVTLRNRIAHAAILTRLVSDGQPRPALLNYLGARARGGTALIVSEPLAMTRMAPDPSRVRAWDDAGLPGLQRMAEAVESADCRLLGQLQHPGRGRHEVGRNDAAVGASALPDDLSWTVPRALEAAEIQALIDDWATACLRLQRAGFSGVEISAGHGHLIHQFLSPWSNRREDQYGGDLAGRCRLLTELLAAIRSACSRPFLIGLKLPGDDGVAGSIDLSLARRIAEQAAATGHADYWTFAWGAHARSLYRHLPDAHGPRHPYLSAISELRKADPAIATGALGYLTDPHECEAAIAGGFEMVFLGRPLITEPAFADKARSGKTARIRYCVSGNSCWRSIIEGRELHCDNNPQVGETEERQREIRHGTAALRVVVVGAGIAGLEAALHCARGGHRVTVLGQSKEAGGKTRLHAALPGGENLSSIYDYQVLEASRAGARIELGTRASVEDILALRPDAVVLATGATLSRPAWLPDELVDYVPGLRAFVAGLLDADSRPVQTAPAVDGRLVLLDADHTEMTYAAAQYLAGRFSKVTLVTPRERIASDTSLINRQGIYQRLHDSQVDIVTCCDLHSLESLADGVVAVRNVFNEAERILDGVIALTFATSRQPRLELAQPLLAAGLAVHTVGDCRAPGSVMAATRDGYRLALRLTGQETPAGY